MARHGATPYLLTSLVFLAVALLAALDAALTHAALLPWFNGLRWLRVHLITLGLVTETLFGLLPLLAAARAGLPAPPPRLDIWLLLTSGILVLLAGIPLVNPALILGGGSLVFAATLLLLRQLAALRRAEPAAALPAAAPPALPRGRPFYLAGLAFFLVGILVGTGLWLGWSEVLRIAAPIEVHIHANSWGFLALAFAGLLVDQYPHFAGRPLAWPGSVPWIRRLMILAALGLVLGPWLARMALTAPGMLLFLGATIALLANLAWPLRGDPLLRTPGLVHLFAAYAWIIAPLLFAPFILLGMAGFPTAAVEGNAPQALIYGWALQLGVALFPFLYARALLGPEAARLGGSWLSVAALNLGSFLLFAGIFDEPRRAVLHMSAYLLWTVALVPFLAQLYRISRSALAGA